jgi:hypothetical protein
MRGLNPKPFSTLEQLALEVQRQRDELDHLRAHLAAFKLAIQQLQASPQPVPPPLSPPRNPALPL